MTWTAQPTNLVMRTVSGPYHYRRFHAVHDDSGVTRATTLAHHVDRGPVSIAVMQIVTTSPAAAALGAAYDRRRRTRRRAARR